MFISRRKTIEILKNSGLVAIKTDTIYGLSCSIYAESALKKIYEIKNRDHKKPLITLFESFDTLLPLVLPPNKHQLAIIDQYWPGPVTLIFELKKNHSLTPLIHDNNGTIAARVPSCHNLRQILKKTGPIASTSINLTNEKSLENEKKIQQLLGVNIGLYKANNSRAAPMPSTIYCFKRGLLRAGSVDIKPLAP